MMMMMMPVGLLLAGLGMTCAAGGPGVHQPLNLNLQYSTAESLCDMLCLLAECAPRCAEDLRMQSHTAKCKVICGSRLSPCRQLCGSMRGGFHQRAALQL